MKVESVTDVAISETGNLVAMIVELDRWTAAIVGEVASLSRACLRGSWPVSSVQEITGADRIFLFDENQDGNILVLLEIGSRKVMFCNPKDGSNRGEVDCTDVILAATLTRGRRRLLVLVRHMVFIIGHVQQTMLIVERSGSDLGSIAQLTDNPRRWSPYQSAKRLGSNKLQMSEDGCAVLVAWDANNEQSIVMSQGTSYGQCRSMIEASGESLSTLCSLTHDGRKTLFIDIEACLRGLLRIGIFDESSNTPSSKDGSGCVCAVRRVTERVTLQTLPLSMSDGDVNAILNSMSYDLTSDCKTLITIKTPCNQVASASLEQGIATFDVRSPDDDFTNYDRLIAQTTFDVNTTLHE